MMQQLLRILAVAAGALSAFAIAAPANAAPGPGPGMCQYLGTEYPIYYPCDQYQPWLPYGTVGNPPASGPFAGSDCADPINAHNMGCS